LHLRPNTGDRPLGPKGRLLSGNLAEFRRDPLSFYRSCAREHGDVVPFRLGPKRFLLVSDPELIRDVLATNNHAYRKIYLLRMNRLLFGDGLLTSEGELWRRQRRLAQPAFHHQRIAGYGQVMAVEAERMLSTWRNGETRDVHAELMDLTLRIAGRALFGADVAPYVGAVADALRVALARHVARMESLLLLPERFPTPASLQLQRAVGRLDRIVYRVIDQRRASDSHQSDLLGMLLAARDEGDGTGMTDRQVRDEVLTLLLAGHETTAIALTWTLYLLSRHPQVEATLAAELDRVLHGQVPAIDDLPRLAFTSQVVTESLRLYPPAWAFGREAIRDSRLGGHRVAAGTSVVMSQWVLHRDPRYYAGPEIFDPSRWAGGLAKHLPPFAYLPFGGGPRRCIGSGFAMTEAVLLLAMIAQRFRMTLSPGHPVTPWPTITLRPKHGIRMVLHARR
jgi:cytochrome P450